jgi:hypothetical protein
MLPSIVAVDVDRHLPNLANYCSASGKPNPGSRIFRNNGGFNS